MTPHDWSGQGSTADWSGIPNLAETLNRLFETVLVPLPSGARAYTNEEVSQQLAAWGVRCSISHLSLLRTGARTNPAAALLGGIAQFFGVTPMVFFDPAIERATFAWLDERNETLLASQRN